MEQQVITDISLSARIIGAAFYYPPTEACCINCLSDIILPLLVEEY